MYSLQEVLLLFHIFTFNNILQRIDFIDFLNSELQLLKLCLSQVDFGFFIILIENRTFYLRELLMTLCLLRLVWNA